MEAHPDDHRPGLSPPRFSLATLLIAVAVLGILFAAMSYLSLYATLLVILFLLTVAAHVAGNAIGTQLRDSGSRRPAPNTLASQQKREPVAARNFAPASELHHRCSLGKPIVITTAAGSIAAGVLGGYGLMTLMEQPTVTAIALGVFAAGVLGGIWTFLASSFLQVASGAWRQAARDAKR